MGKSTQRTQYFDSKIKNQPDADSYIKALEESPYLTHKKMAVALSALHLRLKNELGGYVAE